MRSRFQTESEAVAQLQHPNIVQIFEIGECPSAEGPPAPYLAFEYISGGSLEQKIGNKPQPIRLTAQLVQTLAEAIHYAHGRGIIHRDLKPSNILLQITDGKPQFEQNTTAIEPDVRLSQIVNLQSAVPKITDFGIAKRLAADTDQTRDGQIIGTPSYMAPEQAAGLNQQIGPATDVYSLGVILYQMLTGRTPLVAETDLETLLLVRNQEPVPARQLRPLIPRDLETICLQCLRKEPEKRYPSAQALAQDLQRFLSHEPIKARRTTVWERSLRWSRRNPVVTGLILAVVLVAFAGLAGILWQWGKTETAHQTLLKVQHERTLAQIDTLLAADPGAVPVVFDNLKPFAQEVVPRLREVFQRKNTPSQHRLRAAFGLAAFGEVEQKFLLESISSLPVRESENLVQALRQSNNNLSAALLKYTQQAIDPIIQAKYAFAALYLGDPRPAQFVLKLQANPAARTAFIHRLDTWPADRSQLAAMLREVEDPDFRSGLCLALGLLKPGEIPTDVKKELQQVMTELYRDAPHGSTHSAAGWTLRQWQVPLPALSASRQPVGKRHWFVNESGMTMIAIPAGTFVIGAADEVFKGAQPPHQVTLTQPFFMSDCEVTIALYGQFLNDPDPDVKRPANLDPDKWRPSREIAPTDDSPAQYVSWEDALLFCNWLSLREGRVPCYWDLGVTQASWHCVVWANGYRLPTEAEWEYACRAKAATKFSFGDDDHLLTHYAWYLENSKRHFWPVAQKMPNGWGLFDMYGNVTEWCWDKYNNYPKTSVIDPFGPKYGDRKAHRGGGQNDEVMCSSAFREHRPPQSRFSNLGFRVVCGASK